MAINLDEWLSETADEPPCGTDLEYDNEFLAFEQLARGKPEQQYGDTVIPAEAPDWRAVERAAARLFQRTKDLRVAAQLSRAWTRIRAMDGFADGLELCATLLDKYWAEVHPRLEIDGEHDPLPRANALGLLVDADGLAGDVRATMLLQVPGASLTVREAEAILNASAGEGASMTRGQLAGIIASQAEAGNPSMLAVRRAEAALNALRGICMDRLGPESSPDFSPIAVLLGLLTQPMTQALPGDITTESAETAVGIEVSDRAASSGAATLGEIRGREDAQRLLGLVCDYLERHEPTNPAPLLIRRAQKMMGMDFLAIIQELAPDSLGEVRRVTGTDAGSN